MRAQPRNVLVFGPPLSKAEGFIETLRNHPCTITRCSVKSWEQHRADIREVDLIVLDLGLRGDVELARQAGLLAAAISAPCVKVILMERGDRSLESLGHSAEVLLNHDNGLGFQTEALYSLFHRTALRDIPLTGKDLRLSLAHR